jgi:hypothetical protein
MQHPKIVDGLIQKTRPIPISASFAHVGSSAGAACDSFPTPHSYNRRFAHAGRIWGSPRTGAAAITFTKNMGSEQADPTEKK